MFSLLKFLIFFVITTAFGFSILQTSIKLNSLILLTALSSVFGISSFILLTHLISFLIGPANASIVSIVLLLLLSLALFVLKKKEILNIEKDINTRRLLILLATAILICFLTFLGIYRYGTFDIEVHIPMALTMFNNNNYPPLDPFQPNYTFLYHYGGDLLAGAIYHLCNFEISRAYEMSSAMLSGLTFLCFFSLGFLLSKNYKISFLSGFCSYFGGSLLWLDAILRYVTKNLPLEWTNWSFLQTFLNLGIHGSITNPPSILAFTSTSSLGNPLLIFSFIIFWKMLEKSDLKNYLKYICVLISSLFILYITADWLFITFWVAVIPFSVVLLLKQNEKPLIPTVILLIACGILVKTIGNPLFLQDPLQNLGRNNILNLGVKEHLFTVVNWGRLSNQIMNYQTTSLFSWDFICEFGLSIILLPLTIFYLMKTRNLFAILLFLSAVTTMPMPLFVDFKINPVELVRLFAFGNSMLFVLLTCGLCVQFKVLLKKKIILMCYLIVVCTSPILQLGSSILFTPNILMNKPLVQHVLSNMGQLNSFNSLITFYKEFDSLMKDLKYKTVIGFKEEIDFLKNHKEQNDIALSTELKIPSHAGVYSYIPSRVYLYWDMLYSSFRTIYQTIFTTIDPYLLDELKIKWLIIKKNSKELLPQEAIDNLENQGLVNLVYIKNDFEIYKVIVQNDNLKNYERKTAWVLTNSKGQPLEITNLQTNKITLFPSYKASLLYLKEIVQTKPELKKEFFTAQPLALNVLEAQINSNNLNIILERRF